MDSGKPADEELEEKRDEKPAALAKGLRSGPLAVAEVLDEEPESRILTGSQKVEE
jgi:hypothetical protein